MAKKMKKGKKIAIIAASALAVVMGAGVVAGIVNDDRKDVGGLFSYEIGTLNEQGKETKGDTSAIRMTKYHDVEGLNVELEKGATVSYEIFFYDEDKAFLTSLPQTDDFDIDLELPEAAANAEYFKIVITPNADAEVSKSEIAKYESQLEVTVNK